MWYIFVSILTAYMSDRILICVFIISSLQLFGALFCFYRAISVQFSPKSSLISIYRLEVFESNGNYVNDNTLTVTMKRLREKLRQPSCLKTVRSIGYRMEEME